MRARKIVISGVGFQHAAQMGRVQDNHTIETFPPEFYGGVNNLNQYGTVNSQDISYDDPRARRRAN